jgi:hypothetical protein
MTKGLISHTPSHRPGRRLRLSALVAALGAFLLIVACGGGGGGDAGGGGGGGGGAGTVAAWQISQLLETTDGAAASAKVAINSSGVAYAVWVQQDGTQGQVFSSRYIDGKWQPARSLPTTLNVNETAAEPNVVVHPDGTATAIWIESDIANPGRGVFSSSTSSNGDWLPASLVQSAGAAAPEKLKLVSDGRGNAMAIWRTDSIIVASYFNGTQFGPLEEINEFDDENADSPDIAMDYESSGNALAVWVENDNNGIPTVFSRFFNRGLVGFGNWSATAVPLNLANAASTPRVAMSPNDRAVVTWIENKGAERNVGARMATSVSAAAWEIASTTLDVGVNDAPVAAIDSQGRAVVAWDATIAGTGSIESARFDGTAWKTLDVETGAGEAFGVQVHMDANGRAFAVWSQISLLTLDLVANRLDPVTGAWGTPELIETEDSGDAFSASLAVNGDGRAVAAWQQREQVVGGLASSIAANIFK